MTTFGDYSKYYDLLYRDKDYEGEARYVDELIRKHRPKLMPGKVSMLEFGCGTGRYTREFSRLGYAVHGVDLSEEMLAEAGEKNKNIEGPLKFSCGDMRYLRLDEKYDVVAALFHVLSYQTANQDVMDALQTVKAHLKPGGIAVLDFWYGPAVLTLRPEVRVKEIENDVLKITRAAIPTMRPNDNVVDVNYKVFVKYKDTGGIEEFAELHSMRYFFKPELLFLFKQSKLNILEMEEAVSRTLPSFSTWGVTCLAEGVS